jgi:hypothetical protein
MINRRYPSSSGPLNFSEAECQKKVGPWNHSRTEVPLDRPLAAQIAERSRQSILDNCMTPPPALQGSSDGQENL